MSENEHSDSEDSENGPNSVCHTCGGLRSLSEPRLYVVQATEKLSTGMTMAQWRTCPHCSGKGYLRGIHPPV